MKPTELRKRTETAQARRKAEQEEEVREGYEQELKQSNQHMEQNADMGYAQTHLFVTDYSNGACREIQRKLVAHYLALGFRVSEDRSGTPVVHW